MARIPEATAERIYSIKKWMGLNQAADGKTRLKLGEASEMVNFRVTAEGVLRKRPGLREAVLFQGPVNGSWHGYVAGEKVTVIAAGVNLFTVSADGEKTVIGSIANSPTEFFGFGEKLYLLNGTQYKVWDGETLSNVADSAYVPVTISECPPAGGGTELEGINALTQWRRVWFSPDGSATSFKLPEVATEVTVTDRVTGDEITTGFTFTAYTDHVDFSAAPSAGTDTLEIAYKARIGQGADAPLPHKMRFAELYNGGNDNRVFLCGDGSNRVIYSGVNELGEPDASYFPALNVISVGDENTPVTQLIRHFSRLLVFKTDSAYSIYYGQLSDESGMLIPAFYCNPVNKAVGNAAPGQVCLVENNPITLFEGAAYHWRNTGAYSSNLTIDERQAKRISDRVWREMRDMDLESACCYDDNERKEWYCVSGSRAVVYNYGVDAWYIYDQFPVRHMLAVDGKLFGAVGSIWAEVTDEARNDLGSAIDARWASGYMPFDADYRRKYSSMLWIAMEPMTHGEVTVTIETDRKADFSKKVVARNRASFDNVSFAAWSFLTSSRPYVTRLKLKAKKFTYYRIILTNNSDASSCVVTAADVRVRYTGYVR